MSENLVNTNIPSEVLETLASCVQRLDILENNSPKHDFNDDFRLKVYEIHRSHIIHEDNLIGQRMSYLLTSQAFLVTPYILSFLANLNVLKEYQVSAVHNIQAVIPILGLLSCLAAFWSVLSAVRAISRVKENYSKLKNLSNVDVGVTTNPMFIPCLPEDTNRLVPPIHSKVDLHIGGLAAPFGAIIVVAAVWIMFIVSVARARNTGVLVGQYLGLVISILTVLWLIRWANQGYIRRLHEKWERENSKQP